jgi:hypothetical protein
MLQHTQAHTNVGVQHRAPETAEQDEGAEAGKGDTEQHARKPHGEPVEGDVDRVVSALRHATIRGKKVTVRRYVEQPNGGDRPDRGRGDAPARPRQAGKPVRRERW